MIILLQFLVAWCACGVVTCAAAGRYGDDGAGMVDEEDAVIVFLAFLFWPVALAFLAYEVGVKRQNRLAERMLNKLRQDLEEKQS